MSAGILTSVLTHLGEILKEEIGRQEARLICGVERGIKKMEREMEAMEAVLDDAEKRQVKEESVKVWLENLRDVCYEAEDVYDEWMYATMKAKIEGHGSRSRPTRKVCRPFISIPCFGFSRVALVRRDMALKIKKINVRLEDLAVEKERYKLNEWGGSECPVYWPNPTSFIRYDAPEVEGRDAEKKSLLSKLLSFENQEKGLNIVSIVGLGGIGKTSLAQSVYNSSDVKHHFNRKVWVCVSEPFDEVRIAKAILGEIEGNAPYLRELETVARKIRNHVQGRRFLLVLDDVCSYDFWKWEQLFNSLETGAAGSKILVTTRDESVAKIMGSSYLLPLGKLSDVDSWSLFRKIAFPEGKREERESLEKVGREIAKKCNGLPLAIKAVASLMRFKSSFSDWQDVLNSEFWELEEAGGGCLFPPLMLSYSHLPSTLKRCFSFCAVFPKGHIIEANNLIQLWMAQGYLTSTENGEMEVIGQEYLQNLAMRSFCQDLVIDKKDGRSILSLKMHDLIQEFARHISENECSVIESNNDFQRKMESSPKRTRHLTVVHVADTPFPDAPNVDMLFTSRVLSSHNSPPITDQLDQIEPDCVGRLARLRALDLSRNRIGVLPKQLGHLTKLKHLNLSHNPFWELPETLGDLYNLITMKLSACHHLRRLPPRVHSLIKLRHLEIDRTDSLRALPKGIGDMSSLRTLSKFIIHRGAAACGLRGLKNLNNLRGCLRIEGLGYAADSDEVKKAELKKKIHLSELHLDFSPSIQTGRQHEVIEVLEVPKNLKCLQILLYGGTRFPEWMVKLTNLQELFLQDC